MSWKIGFSRNLILKLHNYLKFFYIALQEKSQKILTTIIESKKINQTCRIWTYTHKYPIFSGICIMVEEKFTWDKDPIPKN